MRRSRRNQTKPLTLLLYSTVLVAGIGGLGMIAYQSIGKPIADELGCFDTGQQAHTLVLTDVSEPRWNEEQQRSLLRYFTHLYDTLKFNERLNIYTSEGDQMGSILTPRFHVCGSASNPQELEAINAETATRGYLHKEKQRRFDKFFQPEMHQLLSLNPDNARRQRYQSPVLEMLQTLSRQSAMAQTKRLVVISDLLQNSDTAQFCRTQNDMPKFEVFRQRKISPRIAPDGYEGIKVEVLMLQRHGYGTAALPYCRDEEEIVTFFRDYFTHHGAASVTVTRLRHGFTE